MFDLDKKMHDLEKKKLIEMYKIMVKIRKFEEKLEKLVLEGLIPGFIHLYIGEEAVASGACANLRKDDCIVSTHRGHGHCLAKGGKMKKIMAELFGKATGYCKGRGGSMHICAPEIGVVGCSGIVGAGIPIAAGVGLAIKLRETDNVCVCFFGDGASNIGAFHEGLNIAALWKLPIVFVCENNLYAISLHVSKSTLIKNIADRAKGYGMPGFVVDGMNVIEVYKAVRDAVKRARRGDGPTLIECKTYRFRGHSSTDSGTSYRTLEEIRQWEERDPIIKLRTMLIRKKLSTEKEIEKIEQECQVEVQEATEFAKESPEPDPATVLDYLFAK